MTMSSAVKTVREKINCPSLVSWLAQHIARISTQEDNLVAFCVFGRYFESTPISGRHIMSISSVVEAVLSFISFSVEIDFRRQNLTSKVDLRSERIIIFIKAVDP